MFPFSVCDNNNKKYFYARLPDQLFDHVKFVCLYEITNNNGNNDDNVRFLMMKTLIIVIMEEVVIISNNNNNNSH